MIIEQSFIAHDYIFALCATASGYLLTIDSINKLVKHHETIADNAKQRYEANKRWYLCK